MGRDAMKAALLKMDGAPKTRNPWARVADHALIVVAILGVLWIFAEHRLLPSIREEAEWFGFLGLDEGGVMAVVVLLFGERIIRRRGDS